MFSRKKSVSDPFYASINRRQLGLYQKYLNGLLLVIDIDNYTQWTVSHKYDREKLRRDQRLIARVCRREAASYGLSPELLQTMIHQYILADPSLRERFQDQWVDTVVYGRETMNFFPQAKRVRRLLDVGLKVDPSQEENACYRLSA